MILAIGYGNPLCGDDGIGPYAVGRLADSGTDPEFHGEVECLSLHQLTPELAEPISRASAVIFIDAACDSRAPGGITCYKLARPSLPTQASPNSFTHHVDPQALLATAEYLYGRRPTAYLYTISGENFNMGDAFSPAVEAALPGLLERLKARVVRCMNLVSLKQ